MELGTLQIQIFVSLVVVLGTAFVAFLCDFLKGNNEQLRERNIEMRVRQDERDRLGVTNSGSLLKGIESLLRNTSGLRTSAPEEIIPVVEPAEPEVQTAFSWEQPIVAPAAKGSAWASKEELEKLAERAARIRERHEARKVTDELADDEPVVLAPVTEMPSALVEEAIAEVPEAAEIAPLAEFEPAQVEAAEVEAAEFEPAAAEAAEVETGEVAGPEVDEVTQIAEAAFEALAEPAAEAVQETPPPLMVEEVEAPASVEAEATPVFESVVEITPEAEIVSEEVAAEEPASRIKLQPLTPAPILHFEAPYAEPIAIEEQPEEFAAGPGLVIKPMGTATIIPSEPQDLLPQLVEAEEVAETLEILEVESEPELLRVRVVPIDQSEPEAIAEPIELPQAAVETTAEPVAEASVEEIAPEPAAVEPEPVPEPVEAAPETIETAVADLVNGADISSLHESLVKEEAGLPPGLHPAEILREQIKANAPFQGVSVSIGINDFEALKQKLDTQGGADSLASIEKMIRGMLKEPDFACRFQDDEFILLFPGEADSAAQRRLFQISEKLWDFQLRSLGHHSIMFSWGGLEVKRDSLSDAVSAARERMFQTKRNRTGAIEMRKRVVNG